MTDPIKLSNERVREILAWACEISPNFQPPTKAEIQALAQAVLDLRTAESLNDHTREARGARCEGGGGAMTAPKIGQTFSQGPFRGIVIAVAPIQKNAWNVTIDCGGGKIVVVRACAERDTVRRHTAVRS